MSDAAMKERVDAFMQGLEKRNPGEPEFHQAVHEFVEHVMPFVADNKKYEEAYILERMTEPDRIVSFRVTWMDDEKRVRANRGWRVQFNNTIGPYKGGLRFHPTVTQGTLKFLGFEQIFKNSLTGLPMGGAKGGSNFNPKGKSDEEIMRFCQAFMMELYRHIGPNTDVPAGDIGVGAREISYLFGAYKKLANEWTGTITGKSIEYGGSLVRKEATGYGCVYFCQNMLKHINDSVEGKKANVSGSGNVAIYTAEKLLQLGASVHTMSDSSGYIYDPDGINEEKLAYVKDIKEVQRKRISEYVNKYPNAKFVEGKRPWEVPCELAFPCATQNEISVDDAKQLVANGVKVVCEGANMPTELSAMHELLNAGILFGPAKAANAGGVAVSGLEQSQNALRLSWTKEDVEERLRNIMKSIHDQCVQYGGQPSGPVNYVKGSNIAGFVKVADSMIAYGAV